MKNIINTNLIIYFKFQVKSLAPPIFSRTLSQPEMPKNASIRPSPSNLPACSELEDYCEQKGYEYPSYKTFQLKHTRLYQCKVLV